VDLQQWRRGFGGKIRKIPAKIGFSQRIQGFQLMEGVRHPTEIQINPRNPSQNHEHINESAQRPNIDFRSGHHTTHTKIDWKQSAPSAIVPVFPEQSWHSAK
jgi:hypothetical protein